MDTLLTFAHLLLIAALVSLPFVYLVVSLSRKDLALEDEYRQKHDGETRPDDFTD